MQTVTNIINKLNIFWSKQNCSILQPIDLEVGAGTFHPLTFFKSFGREKWMAAFTQTCRRPSDIKNTTLNIKWQKFNQYQVIMKPSPLNIKTLYLKSLKEIGINLEKK
jgi:glycyl-tRNA synthetase alpha chain